jgi:23S rRNA pseudouridine2605 synthase
MPPIRLQKILAQAGVASRRKAEEIIAQGRVRVDGRIVTELGVKADETAKVELDGKRLVRAPLCYGILHKPKGMLTTLSDPEGRPTAGHIFERIGLRVVPVGRLDFNTSGALLFTNDGDFAAGLSHARSKVPKVYRAKVRGELDESQLGRWAERIEIDGRKTEPANVHLLRRERGHTWLEITLYEGRNRQVRRLGDHAGSSVVRLTRVSHAGIGVEDLDPGQFRLLTLDELKTLKASFGHPKKVRGAVLSLAELPGTDFRAPRSGRSFRVGGESRGRPGARPARNASSGDRPPSGERSAGSRGESRPRPALARDGARGLANREGRENARRPTSRTDGPRPGGARSAGARPTGARSTGPRPTGTRSAGARPAGVGPVGARPRAVGKGPARKPEAREKAAPTRSDRGSAFDRHPKKPR